MNKILIIDFGSQYTQLIAKSIRNINIYCEIVTAEKAIDAAKDANGVILSGSPVSVNDPAHPDIDLDAINIPILGICYGAQLIAYKYGARIDSTNKRDYGKNLLKTPDGYDITSVWMSHSDAICDLTPIIQPLMYFTDNILATFKIYEKEIYGIQFHPEVTHTVNGHKLLEHFIHTTCGVTPNWFPKDIGDSIMTNIDTIINKSDNINKKIVMAISGDIDSILTAVLINNIAKERLIPVFINNGLMRKNECDEVIHAYSAMGLDVVYMDRAEIFVAALHNVSDPEQKRKIIGKLFIDTFAEQCRIMNLREDNCFLCQATIYPDIIESGEINPCHNVGGLSEQLDFQLLEPIKYLFKADVRKLAEVYNVPPQLIGRHPYPDPGLAIRINGDITHAKITILKEADHIYINYLRDNGLYDAIWKAGAILLPIQSFGVMGDRRTHQYVLALRAITIVDGMTTECYKFNMDDLTNISTKIINEVAGINRVVYDISSNPSDTIEWE
jgi:GMP synthase (glutamine-hydrolysing)